MLGIWLNYIVYVYYHFVHQKIPEIIKIARIYSNQNYTCFSTSHSLETTRNNEKQRQGSAFEEVLNQGTKALRRPLRSGSSLGGSAPLAGAK